MDIVSGYAAGIEKMGRKIFGETEQIYRDAVSFLISVYEAECGILSQIKEANERDHAANNLVHTTKKNTARYDFDARFPKMPSYLRRTAAPTWKLDKRRQKWLIIGCIAQVMTNALYSRMMNTGLLRSYTLHKLLNVLSSRQIGVVQGTEILDVQAKTRIDYLQDSSRSNAVQKMVLSQITWD